jgi:hypothetical protein
LWKHLPDEPLMAAQQPLTELLCARRSRFGFCKAIPPAKAFDSPTVPKKEDAGTAESDATPRT